MKILYAIDSLQTGGAERSTLEIASRLKSFTPIVAYFYRKNDYVEFCKDQNISTYSLSLRGSYDFWNGVTKLRQLIRSEKVDLVVGTLLRSELISRLACKLEGIPNIGTFVNDTYSTHEFENIPFHLKAKIRIFQIPNAISARWCRGFISNSESIKISNAKALQLPLDKIEVIYRGRETNNFPEPTLKARNPNLFLNVARLIPRKGQMELIEAFAKFNQKYPETRLSICGEGSFRSQLEQAIRRLDMQQVIKLEGNVSNVKERLYNAGCFVLPSHYEGFSGALIEAMLSGIPIICSDIPMNKEAIVAGTHGQHFKLKNVESLFNALEDCYLNQAKYRLMGLEARSKALSSYHIDDIVAQHENYYKKILS